MMIIIIISKINDFSSKVYARAHQLSALHINSLIIIAVDNNCSDPFH